MKNTQVDAYKDSRTPKYHQEKLLEIFSQKFPDFSGSMLDIGCANGVFIEQFLKQFSKSTCTGIDLSQDLINEAKREVENSSVHFEVQDAISYKPKMKFDLITASGVLGIFEDYQKPLDAWLSWVGEGGSLVIFGCFNSRDVDTIVKFRNNYTNAEWEGGLTSYSIKTIERFLSGKNLSHEFIKFELPFDLEEQENPIRSFTVTTNSGGRLILNGANLLTEFYYLIIRP